MRASPLSFLCLACAVFFTNAHGDDSVDYITEIKPLLQEKCWSCHGVLKQESALRLDHRELMLAGGDSGPAINLQVTAQSPLLDRVQTDDVDLRMPPIGEGSELSATQVDLLKRWIQGGAEAPEEDIVASPLDHWAFQAVDLSNGNRLGVGINPIDALLNAKHQALGLKPVAQADRSLLIRRLYLNVIGLPPTVQQLRDPRSLEQIIDELLASPHHGERWARHWMDVWRYSDWYGLGKQLRYSQKHMWHWRDWIVKSLNHDKGYDRMVLEMLAGDELDPDNPDAVAGTGFLARNYYLFNRTTWLDQTIEHTGKAFLGLTLNCAKCHDHKYDPISHVDYYQFRALFESHHIRLDPVVGETNLEVNGIPRAFDDDLDAVTQLHIRGNPMSPDSEQQIVPSVPSLFAEFQPKIQPVNLPAQAYAAMTRPHVLEDQQRRLTSAVVKAEKKLEEAEQRLRQSKSEPHEDDGEGSNWEFADDFSKPDDQLWELEGDDWQYQNGTLARTTATRDVEYIRLKKTLPADFELTCRYTTTGGPVYRSVTFRFDETPDRQFANFVYTSAQAPGAKVQVAEVRNGNSSYPAAGRANRAVPIGKPIELRFAVRGELVNVWMDGQFVIAYQYSERRPGGSLSLSGFDATVEFDDIQIRSLPASLELVAAGNGKTQAVQDPERNLQIAKAELKVAEAQLAELEAVVRADRLKVSDTSDPGANVAAQQAAMNQALAMLAKAQRDLAVAGDDSAKKSAAQKAIGESKKQIQEVQGGNSTYRSLMVTETALKGPADNRSKHKAIHPAISTGRRLALAQWIVSAQNPLTARVAVNHVWLRHFGEPLVESVFDFGLRAKEPLHLDVLDCLAAEFIQSGYSFRHLHRLILTSDAYQRSTSSLNADAKTKQRDPANRSLWRMNTRRMESQVVRDSLLHLTGTLDLKMGGPSVAVGPTGRRRSLYFLHSRDQHDLFLSTFDDADLLQCYRRSESVVPQQALALANSELALMAAEEIEKRISESVSGFDQTLFIQTAFETLLARVVTDEEVQACSKFCQQLDGLLAKEAVAENDRTLRIRIRLIDSLLNHNDFISIR